MPIFLPHTHSQTYPLGMEFFTAASLGIITDATRVATLGVNRDTDIASAPKDMWEGASLGVLNGTDHKLIPLPQTPVTGAIVSDNVNDTAAGTGLRTAVVSYLDSTYTAKTAVLTMNGTTEVPLPEPFMAINGVIRSTAGTFRGANIGNVSVRDAGGAGKTYAYMAAGLGFARSSLYTVPLGFTLLLEALFAGIDSTDIANKFARLSLVVMNSSGAIFKGLEIPISDAVPYKHDGNKVILASLAEKNSVWLSIDAVLSNNTSVSGGFTGVAVRTSRLGVSN